MEALREIILTNWIMWASLAVVLVSIWFYVTEIWPIETISLATIFALLLLFSVFATGKGGAPFIAIEDMLAGFANPALVTIMALLVVGQALFQTGALENTSRLILSSYETRPQATLLGAYGAVFVISAFVNNTPVVIMFLPVFANLAFRMKTSAARFLMPLSFVSIFAGMTTLIGTSTNLLAADGYQRLTEDQLDFFEPTPIGLLLSVIGMVYLVIAAPLFSRMSSASSPKAVGNPGKQFFAQLHVRWGHPLQGKQAKFGFFQDLPGVTVKKVHRGDQVFFPPFEDVVLKSGDTVIVAATRQILTDVLTSNAEFLRGLHRRTGGQEEEAAQSSRLTLVEAVVAPASRIAGRPVAQSGLAEGSGAFVLGVQRRDSQLEMQIEEIRLEAGDTLLVCGFDEDIDALRHNRDVLLLDASRAHLPDLQKANWARLIALLTVGVAATGMVPIVIAALGGAFGMLLTDCLNVRQAARSLDLRIFLLIGAALGMGLALERSGAAQMIAENVVAFSIQWGPAAVLSAIFLLVAITTNILSNSASAVIFTPIAIGAGQALSAQGLIESGDIQLFVLAVLYGANCCFATPIAYQTNLLVMGPGGYKFGDFIKMGTPLVLLMWLSFSVIGLVLL